MDATRFAGFARGLSTYLTRRTSLSLVAGASLPILSLAASTDAKKRKKLTVCVNGQTVKTPKKKAKKLLKQGATKGACVAPPGCPTGQKACSDTCIPNADCCNCTGGDVCESGACVPFRCGNGGACKVFVTSITFQGIGFNQVAGADTKCTTLANGADLTGTFKAWLSDSTVDAKDRFDHVDRAGPWELVAFEDLDGGGPPPTVVDSLDDLIACPGGECLQHAINRHEDGEPELDNFLVWTGTQADGIASVDNCEDWTNGTENGLRGELQNVDEFWTQGGNHSCNQEARLYCFQQAT